MDKVIFLLFSWQVFLASLMLYMLVKALMYCYFKWKENVENKIFMQEYEAFMQTENNNESNTMCLDSELNCERERLINHMTLGGMLKLEFDDLLSELDDDLELIATGKKSVNDHKEYFKTQVYPKLRNISKSYHPDKVRNKGGSEAEILQATEMQKRVNAVRKILRHFNEKFSECVGFKYSFFAQIEIDVLSDGRRLEQLSYKVLTKLGKLARIKHEKLIPSLNGFLRSSHASMGAFSENNLGDFLQGKNNALGYFSNYLSAHQKLVNELTLLKESFKKDDQLNSIHSMIDKMLKKSMTQFRILNQLNKLFNGDGLELILTKFKFFRDGLDCKQNYEQADKCFTLPFIAYINVLFLCNEIYLKEQSEKKSNGDSASRFDNALSYITPNIVANAFRKCSAIYKTKKCSAIYKTAPIDEEVTKKVEELQIDDLYKISRYLAAYYCHDNKKGEQLAAELLDVDAINKEMAGALLIKVIGIYANCLAEEFKPGKSYEEQVIELLMERQEIIKNGFGRLIEAHEKARDEICEAMRENNAILREQNERMKESQRELEEETRKSQAMIARLDAMLGSSGRPQKVNGVIHEPPSMTTKEMIARLDAILGLAGRQPEGVHKPSCSKITEPDSKLMVPNTSIDGLQLSSPSLSGVFK